MFIKPKLRNQYICQFYNIKSSKRKKDTASTATTYNSLFWHQQTYIIISIYFSYTIYYTSHWELPHGTFHVSLSFLLIALESMQSISVIYTYFVKGQSLVSWTYKLQQLKIKSNTPCINIIYIGFQNSYSFLRSFLW